MVINRQMAAIAASEVCCSAEPAEALRSSTNRCNIWPPALRALCSAQLDGAKSAAPTHADQETEAERQAYCRERPLHDDVFHRLMDGNGGILRGVQHRRSALGGFVKR